MKVIKVDSKAEYNGESLSGPALGLGGSLAMRSQVGVSCPPPSHPGHRGCHSSGCHIFTRVSRGKRGKGGFSLESHHMREESLAQKSASRFTIKPHWPGVGY